MYILYLDESGIDGESSYFVLAGLAVFEREIYWYAQDVDAIQRRYFPEVNYPVEFHVSVLRQKDSSKIPEPFDRLTVEQRRTLINDMYQVIRSRRGVLFAVAIEKAWCITEEPYERGFEDLTSRFDLFLKRINAMSPENEQRGIIAVAESSYRRNLEILGERFRGGTTRWGQLRTISDVPFFLPARNTRLLQLADFCANAIFGRYNAGLTRDFDIIAPRFDRELGRIHGLAHLTRDHECQYIACLSRQAPML
ncbi:MAG: DUF3800 domain-containing protein [Chloroflexi bacterium]|nr:DUF3800 domain-containing protein [Chloroflexota bacterium]